MLSDVKQAIVDKLAALYPTFKIYDDNVPQNFKTPSFQIFIFDQDYGKRLGKKYKSLVSFDLAYFSNKKISDIRIDCLEVQETLLRELDIAGTYRIQNKQAKITDNVLHITFDVGFSEMIVETGTVMQAQETTTNI
jgi:hypothetical protein